MSTDPPAAGLFDREFDTWPVAPVAGQQQLAPRARARRVGVIVTTSLLALILTGFGLISMIPMDPFDGGMRHPLLIVAMLAMDFMIGIGVAAIVGVGLTRLLLPYARLTRTADSFLPIKSLSLATLFMPTGKRAQIPTSAHSEATMLLGCLAVMVACSIVFVVILAMDYVAIGAGGRTDFSQDGVLPGWVETTPYAVTAFATLVLAVFTIVTFPRGLPGLTPRPSD